jgi:hypothetical protein
MMQVLEVGQHEFEPGLSLQVEGLVKGKQQ